MEIDELNKQIEDFQNKLPENGAALLPKVMISRNLADRFHDHVVNRTLDDWRYWVFTNIMGHFVHSFDQEVSSTSHEELTDTGLNWIGNNMSLQQLRKDAYRKLAKLCAKTSIVDDPAKLPEEAVGFVTKRERLQASTASFPKASNTTTSLFSTTSTKNVLKKESEPLS